MKLIFIILFLSVLTIGKLSAQDLDVELKNIRYYDSCACNSETPILVKVCFKTSYDKKENLKAVVSYSENFTYTGKVKEFDNDGNIYYTFCTKQGVTTDFDIYFRTPSGKKSKVFAISAVPEN
ncbi:MAG: hypothetical protein II956_13175 [Bacteroidales bacterium]|nr:hypothetical protein [Bacteroidales bacterium]